jgi:hypothetical protein
MRLTPPTKLTLRASEVFAFLAFVLSVHIPHMSFIFLAFAWLLLYFGVILKKF